MIVDLQTGLTIPDSWVALLKQLQKTDPSAVIAGGAIRDLICMRRPIKDIDFFVKKPNAIFDQWISELSPNHNEYQGSNPYVRDILYYPNAAPLPINVVVGEGYESTYQLIETFDFGLCQVAFDGRRIIKSWAFDWDHRRYQMTMRPGPRQTNRVQTSMARFERWKEKYPDFTLAIEEPPQETKSGGWL